MKPLLLWASLSHHPLHLLLRGRLFCNLYILESNIYICCYYPIILIYSMLYTFMTPHDVITQRETPSSLTTEMQSSNSKEMTIYKLPF